MNRYDWMKVLTQGYHPTKKNKDKKSAENLKNHTGSVGKADNKAEEILQEIVNDSNFVDENNTKKLKSKKAVAQKQKQIQQFRKSNKIYIYGSDIPAPIRSFEDLNTEYDLSHTITDNLVKEKYVEPTPIQMQSWPLLLKRRELLACAPTGSGKTAAFLLPMIHHLKGPKKKGFRAVIVEPTRELAKQIVRESDRLSEGSGLKTSIIRKVSEASRANFFNKIDILVTTPNRLIYLLKMDENKPLLNILEKVEWLIIDESDKLFEDGKTGFRDQLATIVRACSGPNVIRAMFSATLSFDVEEWCKLNLNNVATVTIGVRNICPDVEQSLSFCASNSGKLMELHNILRKGYEIPCLIFVQTKERAQKLCEEILLTGRPVRCIHSDISQVQRDDIVKSFREKKIWILICTELMGRGIDFKGVNLVINYDFPPSIVSYVHRIGRTGRAGKKGKAITFWSLEDRVLLRSIGLVMKNSGSEVEDWILNMKSTSTLMRKRYSKNLPERGRFLEGLKDKRSREKYMKWKAKTTKGAKKGKRKNDENEDGEKKVEKKKMKLDPVVKKKQILTTKRKQRKRSKPKDKSEGPEN